jgi:hypothetical protein
VARLEQPDRANEALVEPVAERADGIGLDLQDPPGRLQQVFRGQFGTSRLPDVSTAFGLWPPFPTDRTPFGLRRGEGGAGAVNC